MEQFKTTVVLDKVRRKELRKALDTHLFTLSGQIEFLEYRQYSTRRKHGIKSKEPGLITYFDDSGFVARDILEYGESTLTTREYVGNNNVVAVNHAGNKLLTLHYDKIFWFIETKSLYVLRPKITFSRYERFNLFGVIDKASINGARKRKELLTFLKSHCENIQFNLIGGFNLP